MGRGGLPGCHGVQVLNGGSSEGPRSGPLSSCPPSGPQVQTRMALFPQLCPRPRRPDPLPTFLWPPRTVGEQPCHCLQPRGSSALQAHYRLREESLTRSEEATAASRRPAPSAHFSRVQGSPEHSHSVPESPASVLWPKAGALGAGAGRVDSDGGRGAGGRDDRLRTPVGQSLGCRLENHTRSRGSIDQLQCVWGGGGVEKGP